MSKITPKWDRRFMDLAFQVSYWSKDPNTKVGAVIVSPEKRVLSLGYNGFPAEIADTTENLHDREFKLSCIVHAEENALKTYDSIGDRHFLDGCSIYVSGYMFPCTKCMDKIVFSGIKRIVHMEISPNNFSRWGRDFAISAKYARKNEIEIVCL